MLYEIRNKTYAVASDHPEVRSAKECRTFLEALGCPASIAKNASIHFEARMAGAKASAALRERGRELGEMIAKGTRGSMAGLVEDAADDEEDDPENEEELFQEFDRALHRMKVASWDEESCKLFTNEDNEDICSYSYTHDSAGNICIDRSSRKVIS